MLIGLGVQGHRTLNGIVEDNENKESVLSHISLANRRQRRTLMILANTDFCTVVDRSRAETYAV